MRRPDYTRADAPTHLNTFDRESLTAYAAWVDRRRLRTPLVFALITVVLAASCGGSDEVPPDPADDSRVLTLASFVRLCGASADSIAGATASLPEIRERAPIADRLAATAADLDQTSAQSMEDLGRLHPADDGARVAQQGSLEIYQRCRALAAATTALAREATQIDDATLNDRTGALVQEAQALSEDIAVFANALQRPGR